MAGPGNLPSTLAAVAPIQDILLHNSHGEFKNRLAITRIISGASHGSQKTLVTIGRGTVRVSRQRNTRPIRWKMVPHPIMRTTGEFTVDNLISDVLWLGSIALTYLLCGIVNAGVVMAWLYRGVYGGQWSQEGRIVTDLGWIHGEWMRVQALLLNTGDQFTLVTFGSGMSMRLTIPPLPTLTPTQRAAVLTTLDLDKDIRLRELLICDGADCALPDVLHFARRHPKLARLYLEPHLLLSTFIAEPSPPPTPGTIHDITAPASYIPHILPAEPNVENITIPLLTSSPNSPAFDIPACIRALNAVAALPGTHPLALSLYFSRAAIVARALPWHAQPSLPLLRVARLSLITDGASGAAVDTALLGCWLAACFPAIIQLDFPDPGEEAQLEEAQVEEALREALSGAQAGDA
ncbi:hypothetical protein DFH09DRAFT_1363907 [Mycena vulgaris]|nr:hypothetical protein DFH09DRAFT_1363907 [Mycena vulgaris]